MKSIIVLVIAAALAPAAWGQLYKYVDKDGKTVYTDQPPANVDSKRLRAPEPPLPPAKAAAPQDRELPKARPEARDAGKKPEQAAESAADREARCQAARANYVIFLDGPVTMRNTGTGERFQLDDKQADAERAKAKAAMDEACKKA